MNSARLAWLRDDPALALAPLAARLAPEQAADFAALSGTARQREFLLSRALLAHTLATTPGLAGTALRFARAPSGRLLLAAPAGWHISLSHADGLAAVLVARTPCGVDIERPRPARVQGVAARYFAPSEQAWLADLPPEAAQRDFFRLWTLKEAAAKARGEGIAHNLPRLVFDLAGPQPQPRGAAAGLQAWQAPVAQAWLAGVVVDPAPVEWHCREVALATLLNA